MSTATIGAVSVWFLEHGARPDDLSHWLISTTGLEPNSCLFSSLQIACEQLDTTPDILRLYIQKGALVRGTGALDTAARIGNLVALDMLIHVGGADVDALRNGPGARGFTALHCAAAAGCVASILALLKSGARRDICDSSGKTPRHTAVECGRLECASALDG